MKLPSGKMV